MVGFGSIKEQQKLMEKEWPMQNGQQQLLTEKNDT